MFQAVTHLMYSKENEKEKNKDQNSFLTQIG